MPRGLRWAAYTSDDGTFYARRVDADQVLDPKRGWFTSGVSAFPLFPSFSRPRRVLGVSPTSGRRGQTVVANVAADLWTGAATTFFIEASDGTIDTMTVVERRSEKLPRPS